MKTTDSKLIPGFGARFQAMRLRARLSQPELAGKLGVSSSYVKQIEQEKRAPSVILVLSAMKVLKCRLGDLVPQEYLRGNWPSEQKKNLTDQEKLKGESDELPNVRPHDAESCPASVLVPEVRDSQDG